MINTEKTNTVSPAPVNASAMEQAPLSLNVKTAGKGARPLSQVLSPAIVNAPALSDTMTLHHLVLHIAEETPALSGTRTLLDLALHMGKGTPQEPAAQPSSADHKGVRKTVRFQPTHTPATTTTTTTTTINAGTPGRRKILERERKISEDDAPTQVSIVRRNELLNGTASVRQ